MKTPNASQIAKTIVATLFACSLALGDFGDALARPGGGQSYGGSSRSSSSSSSTKSSSSSGTSSRSSSGSSSRSTSNTSSNSGSSSGSRPSSGSTSSGSSNYGGISTYDNDYHPPSNGNLGKEVLYAIAVIILLVAGFFIYGKVKDGRENEWSSSSPSIAPAPRPPARRESLRKKLASLAAYDPNFSLALFEDFVYALYAKAHEARGNGTLGTLGAYVSAHAQNSFYANVPAIRAVRGIVIGAMRIVDVQSIPGEKPRVQVAIEMESNFTETVEQYGASNQRTIYAVERWILQRSRDRLSRTPETTQSFACPNCGAPLSEQRDNICQYCKKVVDTGEFDWVVSEIEILDREERAPQLIANVEEVGTDFPTIEDPGAPAGLRSISAKDPAFNWPQFQNRIALIFGNLQLAWSSREWMIARPFVSDSLFQMQLYWIETYKREKLNNITERAQIAHIQCAAVHSDKFFDSITVRVFASSLDYTLRDDTGELVCGSRTKLRSYTEYWTLIRSANRTGQTMLEKRCPNCGGELKVNMAGSCEFCSAKVSSGNFDWVLSRIEQDESYQG